MTNVNFFINPLMLGGNKKVTHTKTKAESCRFVLACVTFLLSLGIKGLKEGRTYFTLTLESLNS